MITTRNTNASNRFRIDTDIQILLDMRNNFFPTEAGQRITWSKTGCVRQQLWNAVITGDTFTRLSISIRGRVKSPEEGQR